jgi:two-component system, OmpR family, response regulator
MIKTRSQEESRLIFVEDDDEFREIMVRNLSVYGYSVKGVASALEFYQKINTGKYDLAILDIGLQDQSGLVIAEYLRKNTGISIVILSAHSLIDERIEGYKSGADLYLAKPVDFCELTTSIENLLQRRVVNAVGAETVTVPAGKSWRLVHIEWAIYSPSGEKVKLTAKEYEFLSCLALQEGRIATRQHLLKVLEYPNNQYGGRALESLVHRLRRKTAGAEESPIRTARGTGYCFLPVLFFD